MCAITKSTRTNPVIATMTFLPTDDRQTSRSQAPRAGALPRSAGIVAGALTLGKPVLPWSTPAILNRGGRACVRVGRERLAQRPPHLLRGDDPSQPSLVVHRRESTEPPQRVVAEERFERGVGADLQGAARVGLEDLATRWVERTGSGTASADSRISRPRKRWAASVTGNQGQR